MNSKDFLRRLGESRPGRAFRNTRAGQAAAAALQAAYRTGATGGGNGGNRELMDKLWRFHQLPVAEGTVLYEAFDGRGILDNPKAVFEYLVDRPDFAALRHVWVLAEDPAAVPGVERWHDHPRVSFVKYRTDEYFEALCTSKYLINNSTFPAEFAKRDEQIYVNTWHGVPVKHMGYDMPEGALESRNVLRNFVSADFLVSGNEFMTETMYRDAYKLGGIFRGQVLEIGQPRIDEQFNTGQLAAKEALAAAGVLIDGRKIVLYAPTWRGTSFRTPDYDVEELLSIYDTLRAGVDSTEYQVLLKVHQYVARVASHDWRLRGVVVPDHLSTNIALSAADILVTDYSSIFFDYLGLDRPIVFFTPDLDDYRENRGLYIDTDRWPGQVVRQLDELGGVISGTAAGDDPFRQVRAEWRKAYCPNDDAGASKRLVDIVFGASSAYPEACRRLESDRVKLLFYAGGFLANGITASLLSLLASIDRDRFDVSIFYGYGTEPVRLANANRVPADIRHFPRIGMVIQGIGQLAARDALQKDGLTAPASVLDGQQLNFAREWRRCFGEVRFDHIIDYSGYSPFWSYLCLQGSAAARSIWVHSDLVREVENEDKRKHASTLPAVFSMYHRFDHIVAVSPALRDITVRKLGRFAAPSAFTSARNLLDLESLYHNAGVEHTAKGVPLRHSGAVPGDAAEGLEDHLGVLADRYGWDALEQAARLTHLRHEFLPEPYRASTFIAVGRLSPEKNYERLVRSFAQVHRRYPDSRLLICGEGVSRPRLEALLRTLGLSLSVALPGHIDGVAALINRAGCLVLSSDYEGQPLVLLEALALGTPVVTTRFDTVEGAVPVDQVHVVDATVDALASGMIDFLEGRVPQPRFDAVAYNERALSEFLEIVTPGSDASAAASIPSGPNVSVA